MSRRYFTNMNTNSVRALLRKRCAAFGSMRAWGRANGVSIAYISDALSGRVEPGHKVLDALGLMRAPPNYLPRKGKASGET